jgi:ornithine carbamoyltransferase
MRHFLQLRDHQATELESMLTRAQAHCESRRQGKVTNSLANRTLICVFEKASTRTRVSFEAAIMQLGGHAITIDQAGSQLGRGEPIEDTARVLSRYGDMLMFRTSGEDRLQAFARAAGVPVINGLSDGGHPVQVLADLLTVRQHAGPLSAQKYVFIGDCASNMARSWMDAARIWDFPLVLACPPEFEPPAHMFAGSRIRVARDPETALEGATVINTDVWTSMGQEAESARRLALLGNYTLSQARLTAAAPAAIVLHCLPAHRGEEITGEVIDGPQSRVWEQAENRLHIQKAILEWCAGHTFSSALGLTAC